MEYLRVGLSFKENWLSISWQDTSKVSKGQTSCDDTRSPFVGTDILLHVQLAGSVSTRMEVEGCGAYNHDRKENGKGKLHHIADIHFERVGHGFTLLRLVPDAVEGEAT